ncbi:ATP-binding protein [Vitiosangium sp. GDMCC 1.1324]|uniref:ATP-binding protein n=1 Tax=Vitiosangium sp. (strain GDMCC 1.1324) TaxID=2138576 RepID=UPI000D3A7C0A|nr:ATP-binding protein [Vitiosangium sp. GDMCC 1.1324]PTL85682.1 hypothetical protein DAT35_02935 [Vitiosangium sp. GDMCC 1.1324]
MPSGHRQTATHRLFSLALLLTAAVGVVLTLGLLRFDQRARQGKEREALAQQTARASKLAAELEAQLDIGKQLLNTLASLAGPLHRQQEIEDLLSRMLASSSENAIYGVGVWFAPGKFEAGRYYMGPYIHRRMDGSKEPPTVTYEWERPDYDYPSQIWYQQAWKLNGGIVIPEPYMEVDQLAYESLTRLFFDDQGQPRGVVSLDILIPRLRELVHHANVSESEQFYVASQAGLLIAHPQEEALLTWAREHGHSPRDLSELSLSDLREWEHEQGLDRGRHTTAVTVQDTGWKVFASTNESTLFAAARNQQWLVVALGIVLWAGLGASGVAMARSERARSLLRTLAERQRQEEERQRLLAQVRQRSAELQAIIESMVDAVVVTDTRGNITLVNRAALALSVVPSPGTEMRRLDTMYRLYPPRELDGAELPFDAIPLNRALRGEQVGDTEFVLNTPQHSQKLVLRVNAAPIRDESGHVVAAVSVARDVTQSIELERLQSEFVKMAAHELKTPLTVMKSFAQLAQRTENPSPALRRLLEGVGRGADRMDRVIRTLLDASQLQLDQLRFEKEEVELCALLETTAARTAAYHPRNPIHVRPGPRAWVLGDPARLEQVLTELLDNAARYSPANHPVEVSLRLDSDEVEISIHDEGIGIPEDRQARVFERFYQAHAGTPHDRGGMGLGLYLARGIILHHGGRIELESREGQGTSVRLRLLRLPERQSVRWRASCEAPAHPPVEPENGGPSR